MCGGMRVKERSLATHQPPNLSVSSNCDRVPTKDCFICFGRWTSYSPSALILLSNAILISSPLRFRPFDHRRRMTRGSQLKLHRAFWDLPRPARWEIWSEAKASNDWLCRAGRFTGHILASRYWPTGHSTTYLSTSFNLTHKI